MPRKADSNVERVEWTSNELLKANLPAPEWVIPNYLPMGLTVLAGRPFAGKSWLALQIAQAINIGGSFFSETARQGKVLYIAKEDANWSLRDRILKQHWQGSDTLKIFTGWDRFSKGGMKKLRDILKDGNYVAVLLDSLYKFLSGNKNEKDGEMEPVMSELQDMYKRGWVDSIVPLVHTNKISIQQGDGGESAVSGDTALMGVADNYLMFYKRPGANKQTYFHAEGRMMKSSDSEVKFNETMFTWELSTKADKVKPDSIKAQLIRLLDEQGCACNPTVVSELTGKPINQCSRELEQLAKDNLIIRLPKKGTHVPYISKLHVSAIDVL